MVLKVSKADLQEKQGKVVRCGGRGNKMASWIRDGDLKIEMPADDSKIYIPNCRSPAPILTTITQRSFLWLAT